MVLTSSEVLPEPGAGYEVERENAAIGEKPPVFSGIGVVLGGISAAGSSLAHARHGPARASTVVMTRPRRDDDADGHGVMV
jgi:hypothetical protein